jgi:hypothetical protein
MPQPPRTAQLPESLERQKDAETRRVADVQAMVSKSARR